MTRERTPIEELADSVVRSDVAVQEALPASAKSTTGTPVPWLPQQSATGRNWPVMGLVVLILVALVGFGGVYLLGAGQPVASPTFAAVVPSPTAATTQPTSSATRSPTESPSTLPVTAPPQTPPPEAVDLGFIDQQVSSLSNGTISILESIDALQPDRMSDTYLPDSGSPAVAEQPYIDLIGAGAFKFNLGDGPAVALSSHACESMSEREGLSWYTACNQSGAMPAGDYLVVVSYWAQPIPDPFPQPAQCVYIVQFDVDDDRATGFQSQLPFNHLIGADVYFEDLFFWDQAGDFRNYILATDHALPERPDTGELHGNLGTLARWFASRHEYDSSEVFVQSAWIPLNAFGDNWSVGGFCNADRTAPGGDTFSVDALGHPGTEPFPTYYDVMALP